jgi:hypothetical protein
MRKNKKLKIKLYLPVVYYYEIFVVDRKQFLMVHLKFYKRYVM